MLERISYLGLPNCYRIFNATTELVVAADIGPRILRYSLIGGGNVPGEYPDRATETVGRSTPRRRNVPGPGLQ